MTLAMAVAAVILVALTVYTLSGGADFGGGVWDLFAPKGEQGERQRALVRHAIGPIWEANHVWLIMVIVLLFVCFPKVFAAVSIALHVPLVAMLIGITLRGTSYVFRAYGIQSDQASRSWERTFAISSAVTPFFLGLTLGAVVSGGIVFDAEGTVVTDFVSEWAAPFPVLTGLLVLVLFAYLAAVYLAVDAEEPEMKALFRKRALVTSVVAFGLAFATLGAAWTGAPHLAQTLLTEPLGIALQALIGGAAIVAVVGLRSGRDQLARLAAMAQVGLIVMGLGVAVFPDLLPGTLSIEDAAAPASVLRNTLIALGVGAVALVPSFWWLYKVFRSHKLAVGSDH